MAAAEILPLDSDYAENRLLNWDEKNDKMLEMRKEL
jgi:hypothetical protein